MSGQPGLNISGSPAATASAKAIVCRFFYRQGGTIEVLGALGDGQLDEAVKVLEGMGLSHSEDLPGAVKLFTANDNALLQLFLDVRRHIKQLDAGNDDEVKAKLAEQLEKYREAESKRPDAEGEQSNPQYDGTQHAIHVEAKRKRENLEKLIELLG